MQQYQAVWQRPVAIERVLNRTQPVAMIGAGTGTLVITGLIGTVAGLDSLIRNGREQCDPLTVIIRGAQSVSCGDGGVDSYDDTCTITLTNAIPQQIQITGSSQQQGIQLQTANLSFVFGGFKLSGGNPSNKYEAPATSVL